MSLARGGDVEAARRRTRPDAEWQPASAGHVPDDAGEAFASGFDDAPADDDPPVDEPPEDEPDAEVEAEGETVVEGEADQVAVPEGESAEEGETTSDRS